jgi:hypothetical protein
MGKNWQAHFSKSAGNQGTSKKVRFIYNVVQFQKIWP